MLIKYFRHKIIQYSPLSLPIHSSPIERLKKPSSKDLLQNIEIPLITEAISGMKTTSTNVEAFVAQMVRA